MRIGFNKGRQQFGGVLVVTLVLAGVLVLTLGGYLRWASTESRYIAESQAWNAALACAEAGIEEGLAQVNVVFGTNYSASAQANWKLLDGVYGPRTNSFTNGSYSAIIIPNQFPTIIATGYTKVPIIGRPIQRTVQVTTTCESAFGNALTVIYNVTTKGTGLMVDSYDSFDPAHSDTNGMYNPLTRKAGGDVNSVGGLINVQNATIYGKLRTGPDGSVGLGNGTVGDLDWNVKGQIEPGWYANDFNAEFKEVTPPYTTGLPLPTITDYKTNAYYFLGTGKYYCAGDFVMSQNQSICVQGVVTLYVTGGFNMKSQNACSIEIAPGGSLKLYVGTPNGAPVAAYLTQVNTLGNAFSFQYYGLPSNTVLSWNGNNAYVGTVYAPQADFSLGGGGSSYFDYQGACVAKSATMNGHFNFHYDENLKRVGPPAGFIVSSWLEL